MERDESSYANVLQLLRERIVSFAASRIRRELAEDVAQDVLRLLVEKYPRVTELSELVPLALKIARFQMMSAGRTSIRRGEHTAAAVDDLPIADTRWNPAELAERRESIDRLKRAITDLGDRCRQLMRYKLEGKAFPEIQKIFGAASINTIYTWDLRCRKQLLEKLGGKWEVSL